MRLGPVVFIFFVVQVSLWVEDWCCSSSVVYTK